MSISSKLNYYIVYFLLACIAVATNVTSPTLTIRATDPQDFSWVKNWAAVGDSYTAGIGSGNVLPGSDDIRCSRYDYAYPKLLQASMSNAHFTYLACSGDTSSQIIDQINTLADNSQDLVILTAGGNDVGLSNILMACVVIAVTTQAACNRALANSQAAIENSLQDNIENLLQQLDPKLTTNGIVVQSLYAKFFDATTDACTNEDWTFVDLGGPPGLPLSKSNRQKMNDLVDAANAKILAAITNYSGGSIRHKMVLRSSNWDKFVEADSGYFCEQGASPDPWDASNQELHFLKFNTERVNAPTTFVRQRSANITGIAKREINIPDSIGRIFHPSMLGHETMASFVYDQIVLARSKILGVKEPLVDCGGKNPTPTQNPGITPTGDAVPLQSYVKQHLVKGKCTFAWSSGCANAFSNPPERYDNHAYIFDDTGKEIGFKDSPDAGQSVDSSLKYTVEIKEFTSISSDTGTGDIQNHLYFQFEYANSGWIPSDNNRNPSGPCTYVDDCNPFPGGYKECIACQFSC